MEKNPIDWAKNAVQIMYEMKIETTSWIYCLPDIPEEFINRVLDATLHVEIMKRKMEAALLWDLSRDPDSFKNDQGEYEYQSWMYDYAECIDAHVELMWSFYHEGNPMYMAIGDRSLNFKWE